ncbi:endopeptidase IV [Legionella taurinensis]|uniref:Endopeptidase IV n=1 Tax=Legionella taurinensis TaxID=70611 RepID=A0A3A5LEY9_9GAMM|nr:endopeptidase IV [Legionella taurinensis]MDX1837453.1 endopeptidase IV [Legionella taurinensis]PUT40798.1 endopeptidase IV [Legionella taurinensis]PUT44220.1 endopeptidase IV [Legionella taurinensis]PUT47521.1 endopeptidase IV [Legionella taurinensis]PUT48660.1 endopeptidase IV [Legionella taurinensis]
MKTITKYATMIVCLGLSAPGLSMTAEEKADKDNRNPPGCLDTGYQFELKALHLLPEAAGAKQSLYFFFNTLSQKINLYQMRDDESSRSLYLNHAINSRQWAALSSTEKEVKFICTVDDPKLRYGRVVDCSQSLRICEYTTVKYGLNNKGNFWLVKSNSRNAAVREVVRYGIIPAMTM